MAPIRVFLGWRRSPLITLVEWVLGELGSDLGTVDLVVPGRRAGRSLLALLAAQASPSRPFVPPRVLTPGELPETLYRPCEGRASRSDRLLAWTAVLENQDLAIAGLGGEFSVRLAAAAELCRVQDELAAAGMGIPQALEIGGADLEARDLETWRELGSLAEAYETLLTQRGRIDVHMARRAAMSEGEVRAGQRTVVLCAVAEPAPIMTRLLEAADCTAYVAVAAPREQQHLFDEWGTVRRRGWLDRLALPLPVQVLMATTAAELGAAVADRWQELRDGGVESVVGITDGQLLPWVERALLRAGCSPHSSVGRSAVLSGPWKLLHGIAGLLETRSMSDLAYLLRNPELEAYLDLQVGQVDCSGASPDLARALEARDWLTVLDRYTDETCLRQIPDDWLHEHPAAGPGSPVAALAVRRMFLGLMRLAGGPERSPEEAPLAVQCARLRELLSELYADREQGLQGGDLEWLSLEVLATVIDELEAGTDTTRAEPIGWGDLLLLLQEAGGREGLVADEVGDVDLVGWLELPLDPSVGVLVVGATEGSLPELPPGDSYLTPPVRRAFGLPDEDLRLARDLFHLTVLSRSRRVCLLMARSQESGEPLAPSRLALTGSADDRATILQRFYGETESPGPESPEHGGGHWQPTRPQRVARLDSLRVTAFRDYLQCPYRFWLRHVEGLSEMRDLPSELSPGAFGQLIHSVLGELGRDPVMASREVETIFRRAGDILDALAAARFGRSPRVVLRVQLEQARRRLRRFSIWQARQAAAGWEIDADWIERDVEASLDVDGEGLLLRGRIDRLDRHPRQGARLIDYKTAERSRTPEQAHQEGRGGAWRDLQLPLYRLMLQANGIEGEIELAFLNLDPVARRPPLAVAAWSPGDLSSAEGEARRVVRLVRGGVFWPPEAPPRYDDGLARIAGDRLYLRDARMLGEGA